jgi:hypothetical protein
MPGSFVGTNPVSAAYVGVTPVVAMYVGTVKVWPSVVSGDVSITETLTLLVASDFLDITIEAYTTNIPPQSGANRNLGEAVVIIPESEFADLLATVAVAFDDLITVNATESLDVVPAAAYLDMSEKIVRT